MLDVRDTGCGPVTIPACDLRIAAQIRAPRRIWGSTVGYSGFGPSPIERKFWKAAKPRIPELQRECPIGEKYRVDFLVPSRKVVIELYGYRYHKTKEKLTSDAERERDLQRRGYQIIRFTGSEITKDVNRCVDDVIAILGNGVPHSSSSSPRFADPAKTPSVSHAWNSDEPRPEVIPAKERRTQVPAGDRRPRHLAAYPLSAAAKQRPQIFSRREIAVLAGMAAVSVAAMVTLALIILTSIT
jgi:very-short-patch-repair endonuclease